MSSTGCCLNVSVLCSSSSRLSFSFPANVCWGLDGVIPFRFLRVLIRLLQLSCSFLCTFVFFSSFLSLTFSMTSELHFQWDLAFGLQCSHLHDCHGRGVFVCLFLRYFFIFLVLEPILDFFLCCCGTIVNTSSLSLGVFLIPRICLRLRSILLALTTLGFFYLLVFNVSCRASAVMSAVSFDSFPPLCLFSSWLANWLLCPCLG